MYSEQVAIRAEGLGKTYTIYNRPLDRLRQLLARKGRHFGRDFIALADVNFELKRGEVLGVVGNNGAGKSTLLQMICGTLQPSAGRVQVNGRVAALLELGAGFNPEFSGRENIFLNAAVLGLSTHEIVTRFDSIVDFAGIGEFIEQPVKTYSSGMYVRLAFAIATSVEPDILIIDEALSVGDGAFARKSFDRIMALRDSGATILFCSHSMYHIEAICNRALWLERGQVRMLGSPEAVTRAYAAPDVQRESPSLRHDTDSNILQPPQGHARLLSVEASVDGVKGKHLQLNAGASTLRIDITFGYDPALSLPSVAFGLETIAGVLVSSGSTQFDGHTPETPAKGVGKTSIVFPKIPLMRGKYRLTLFLLCERTIHVYDHAQYCAELEITHQGTEQGVAFLPHAWGDGPTISVS